MLATGIGERVRVGWARTIKCSTKLSDLYASPKFVSCLGSMLPNSTALVPFYSYIGEFEEGRIPHFACKEIPAPVAPRALGSDSNTISLLFVSL